MGVAVSSSHVVSATSSSLGGGLLTLFPCSSVRSLSRETVLHKFLQHESFPRAAGLHKLPQHGTFLQGTVLQGQTASVWVPQGVTSSDRKAAPAWPPLSACPQVLPEACSNTGFPRGHILLQASTYSGMGSSTGCLVDICCTSMGCRGTPCLAVIFTTGCRGISAPVPGAIPPPLLH